MSVTVTGLSPRSPRQNVQATSPDPSSKTTSPTTADTSASQDTDVNTDHAILMAGLVTAGSTVGSAVLPIDKGGKDIGITPRLLIGTGLTFTALSVLGEF